MTEKRARIFTLHFSLVVLSGLCYFIALAMLTPVLPDYVEKSLGGGSIAVGIAVGAFAVGAIVLRPFAGRIGDTMGRRVLIVGGALIVAFSTVCYGLVDALWFLVVVRILTGFGEAGFFVGAATMITDLAPHDRRGEAVSYWSVAVYGGLSFGPVLGSVLHGKHHYGSVWVVAAALAFLAAIIGLVHRGGRTVDAAGSPRAPVPPVRNRTGHGVVPRAHPARGIHRVRSALRAMICTSSAGLIFVLYGVLILAVRISAARLPDRLGGRATATLALVIAAAGIGLIAVWPTVTGLVVGTIVFAGGMSLMYPALLLLALHGVRDAERGSVVGTFSSFFDLSQGLGAFVCGTVVHFTGYRGAFTTGAICRARAVSWCCADAGATAPAPRTRVGSRRAVVAGHERLPAQGRRHPVVPLRAVAAAAAGGDDGADDAVRGRGGVGRGSKTFASSGCASGCSADAASLTRRIDALAREVRRRRDLPRSDVAARSRRTAPACGAAT